MKKGSGNDGKLRELVVKGFSDNEIAKRLGISRILVLRRRRMLGISRADSGWPKVTIRTKAQRDALYAPHGGANAYGRDDVVEAPEPRVKVVLRPAEHSSWMSSSLLM